MGAEQSTSNKKYDNKDVQEMLRQQRVQYEQKMKQLLEDQNSAAKKKQLLEDQNSAGKKTQAAPAGCVERPPFTHTAVPSYSDMSLETNRTGGSLTYIGQSANRLYPPLPAGTGAAGTTTMQNAHFGQRNDSYNDPFVMISKPRPVTPTAPPMVDERPRPRPGSRNENLDVTCPTCRNLYGEKVYQCVRGHTSCQSCKIQQRPCGHCRQPLTDRRNIEVEKYVAQKIVQKCPNADDGCRLSFKLSEINSHLQECPFKEMLCPSVNQMCRWRGKVSQLPEHFGAAHPELIAEPDAEMRLCNIAVQYNHVRHLVVLGPFKFLFNTIVSEFAIYSFAQLLGTKMSAEKWTYEVHVYNKREPRRKYFYSDACLSATDRLEAIVKDNRCATLPTHYAKTFVNDNSLMYKFYLKKQDKNDELLKKQDNNTNDAPPAQRQRWRANDRNRARSHSRGGGHAHN